MLLFDPFWKCNFILSDFETPCTLNYIFPYDKKVTVLALIDYMYMAVESDNGMMTEYK